MMASLQDSDPRHVAVYRLVERLAVGGMGIVYLGESPSGRQVAVKLIRPELASAPEFRERFRREVETARLVGGFHTAAVVDADPDADPPWMVTQYVPGPSLHDRVKRDGTLDLVAVHTLAAALAEGLQAIHSHGLVHRDLKPLNIIMAPDGPKIIDFGIAKVVGASSDPRLTATGKVVGTPAYLSPEQLEDGPVGPASDIFSLGSVLAFAATGRAPFEAHGLTATTYAIVNKTPNLGSLDGPLLDVIRACLAKDPARRPTASALLTLLAKTTPATSPAPPHRPAGDAGTDAGHASGTSDATVPGPQVLSPRFGASQAIGQAARYFRARFETGADVSADVRGNLAVLLGDLARTEAPDEEEVNSRIRRNRAITLVKGDLDAAQKMIKDEEEARTRTLNIVKMVGETAFPAPDRDQPPAPTVTELLSIWLSQNLIAAAADELRDELPAVGTIELTAGERQWEYRFACDDKAQVTHKALEEQAEEQARRICSQIQKDADRRQGALRWLKKWGCPGGLATAVGLGGATFIPGAPPELMIPAFIVAVPSIFGLGRLPRVVRHAMSQAEKEKNAVTKEVRQAARELADLWQADRESADVRLPDLRGYLHGLTADSVGAATRQVESIPLRRTREFPSWTPRPAPSAPLDRARGQPPRP